MDNYYPRIKDLREDSDYSQYYVSEYLQMKQPQYSFRSYRQPEKTLLNLLNKPFLFAQILSQSLPRSHIQMICRFVD